VIGEHLLRAAVEEAMRSPCAKSKRGVVVFTRRSIVRYGHNHPPLGMACDGSAACREHCNKLCVHAEEAALADLASMNPLPVGPIDMLHVKAMDGVAVPSGPPSCWQCSRKILDSGLIDTMWLLHAGGLQAYAPSVFHEMTLRECGLPIIR
jgi:deoxycytidylate deaminase